VITHPRTAAARSTAHRRGVRRDVTEQTELGITLMRSLRRAQLRLALVVGIVIAVVVGGIPLMFLAFPAVRDARVSGLSLGWVVLGVLVFPLICLTGWLYVRAADRGEAEFVDLVERS
jgi:drug/metabolite transporter (DMT)-like permease